MAVVTVLAILCTPYLLIRLIGAERARTSHTAAPQEPRGHASGREETAGQDGSAWSALDDHQLTRLLTDSAPSSTTEGTAP